MTRKSEKEISVEKWVDEYIANNGGPPSYSEISAKFGLASKNSAYARCKKFRHKMKGGKQNLKQLVISSCRDCPFYGRVSYGGEHETNPRYEYRCYRNKEKLPRVIIEIPKDKEQVVPFPGWCPLPSL